MWISKKTFVLLLCYSLIHLTSSQMSMDSCSIQCRLGSGMSPSSGSIPSSLTGSPGKRGPKGIQGPRGDKGEPAEQCACNEVRELSLRMQELQAELNLTKNALNPKSCRDVLPRHASDTGGVYTIYPFPGGRSGVEVYCDLVTDGGGWIVFQKRIDGSEDFFRVWDDYVNGFGKLDGEFWLGLDNIHRITSSGNYELRIDMEDFEQNVTYAIYQSFVVGNETDYAITQIGPYSGNAGRAMPGAGTRFSTKDKDQDTWSKSCATTFKGGWWYTKCHSANPNGLYLSGAHSSYADGVNWYPFRGYHYSLKRIEMKLRLIA